MEEVSLVPSDWWPEKGVDSAKITGETPPRISSTVQCPRPGYLALHPRDPVSTFYGKWCKLRGS